MSSILDEVYLEILLRLPVRTTYICKCVCKTWLGLVSNPTFIKMHLNLTLQKNNPNLMLRSYDAVNRKFIMHSISHDSLTSFDGNEYDDDAVEMDYPFKTSGFSVELICSCNGLFALWYHSHLNDKEFLCLWNPATQEYKVIPDFGNEFLVEDGGMQALGYDYKIDDYKLVIVVHQDGDKDSLVDVYTLGTNSWKSIESIPYKFPGNLASDVLVNGALHWLGYPCDKYISKGVIASLNVSDERFKVIQLPKESIDSKQVFKNAGVLEGCLCLLVNVPKVRYDIWVMQEYGVRESWTKRYAITHESILSYDYFLNLLWSFKNGEILFFTPGDLVLYDPECASVREPNIVIETQLYANVNYFESLVPLNSGAYVEGLEEAKEEQEEVEEEEEEEEEDEEEEEEEEDEDSEEEV